MFWRLPVSRLSTQTTRIPLARSASHRWEPRKPAPPVTTAVGTARSYPDWARARSAAKERPRRNPPQVDVRDVGEGAGRAGVADRDSGLAWLSRGDVVGDSHLQAGAQIAADDPLCPGDRAGSAAEVGVAVGVVAF